MECSTSRQVQRVTHLAAESASCSSISALTVRMGFVQRLAPLDTRPAPTPNCTMTSGPVPPGGADPAS
jgi:hypothetical protein